MGRPRKPVSLHLIQNTFRPKRHAHLLPDAPQPAPEPAPSAPWETLRGNGGLRLAFLRWFSSTLDYSYADRDDEIDTEDDKVNRVMLTLTAAKPKRL